MATEILVNDGGAPARILPFTAASGTNLSGGRFVTMDDQAEINHADTASTTSLGVLLTDAGSGQNASVITGKGVVLNVPVSGTVVAGTALTIASGAGVGAGYCISGTVALVATGGAVGVYLDSTDNSAGPNLRKVLTL